MSAVLNKSEEQFLKHHGLSAKHVLDARHLRTKEWQEILQNSDHSLVVRSKSCSNAGHRIFDAYNHCIQCHPRYIEEVARHHRDGYVYIAGSLKGQLVKIGLSNDLEQRSYKLTFDAYGGFDDWEIVFYVKVSNAAKIETAARRLLSGKAITATYLKDRIRIQSAKELLQCGYPEALEAIYKAMKASRRSWLTEPVQLNNCRRYSFK